MNACLILLVFVLSFMPWSMEWKDWQHWVADFAGLLAGIALLAALLRQPTLKKLSLRTGGAVAKLSHYPPMALVAAAMALFLLITCSISALAFGHIPHSPDTHAQYAQARIFASGHLYIADLPFHEFFHPPWFIDDGKYYSFYPPGHSALLALGLLAGVPWLINPLFGALTVGVLFFLGKEIGGQRVGYVSMLLMLVSPAILLMSSEFMNHVPALFFASLFALCYIRLVTSGKLAYALWCGVCMGYLCLSRPQCVMTISVPFIIHALWQLRTLDKRLWVQRFGCIVLAAAPFLLFFLYYNWQTTGDPLLTGYQKLLGKDVVPGHRSFRPLDDFARVLKQLRWLHMNLFRWPVSSLLPVFLLFALRAQKPFALLLAAPALVVAFGLLFTPFDGYYYMGGARYFYETYGMLIVLSALFICRLPAVARGLRIRANATVWRGALALLLLAAVVSGFMLNKQEYKGYMRNYWFGNETNYQLLLTQAQAPALVFVKDQSLSFLWPPDAQSPLITARDLGDAKNQELRNYYPGRNVYRLMGDKLQKLD